MKTAERIICMVLAAVMLVTTVPVSAQHFDKTPVERAVAQQTLKNAVPVKVMRARYQQALQLVEKREVSAQDKKRAQKENYQKPTIVELRAISLLIFSSTLQIFYNKLCYSHG